MGRRTVLVSDPQLARIVLSPEAARTLPKPSRATRQFNEVRRCRVAYLG